MNLKNISDVMAKISELDGTNGESASVILTKCKSKVEYSQYSIVPRELLGYNGDGPEDIYSLFSTIGSIDTILDDIRNYFNQVQTINDTHYSPNDIDEHVVSNNTDNESDGREGNLTLTDDSTGGGDVPNENPEIGGNFGDAGEGTVNGSTGGVVGGIVGGMSSADVGGSVGFEDGNPAQTGTLVVTDPNAVITDENGNVISQVNGQEYTVYEVKYDENGNPTAVRVSADGEPEQWINLNQNGTDIGVFIENGQDGMYSLTDGTLNIYDENGNIIGTIQSGDYRVYDVNYDENGNVIAIRISRDGEPEQWVNICENGTCVGTYTPNPILDSQVITLDNDAGKLSLFNKKTAITGGVIGVLAIAAGAAMYIKNKKGEKVSKVKPGNYDVYDVYQDETGKITDARISASEEDEYWVHF